MRLVVGALLVLLLPAAVGLALLLGRDGSTSEPEAVGSTAKAMAASPTVAAPDPTATPEPPRGLERHTTLIDVETGATFPLWTETQVVTRAEFSPDGRWLAFGRSQIADLNAGSAQRINLRQSPDFEVESLGEGYYISSYSPQNDLAIYAPDGHPVVLTADGERRELANEGHVRTWSPDGRWLTYEAPYGGEGVLIAQYLVDTETWEERRIGASLPCNCDANPRPLWAPNSRHFIYAYIAGPGRDGLKTEVHDVLGVEPVPIDVYTVFGWLDATHYVRLSQKEDDPDEFTSVDISTGASQMLFGEAPGSTWFSPDWQHLAVQGSGAIHIRDLAGNLVAEGIRGDFGEWSDNGALLITYVQNSECGMAALVYTVDGDLRVCAPGPSYHGQADAAMSPDNRFVATIRTAGGPSGPYPPTDTDVYITEIATGIERLVAEDLYGDIACIDWSQDSRFLVVGHLCGL